MASDTSALDAVRPAKEAETVTCPGCHRECTRPGGPIHTYGCAPCKRIYPQVLLKAACDPFDYALKLRTGEVIRFYEAHIHGDHVTLSGQTNNYEAPVEGLQFACPRGVDVRIADIVWCADAPEGS